MILADWIIQQLTLLRCGHVFLVPGGEIDPLVTALGAQSEIKTIVTSHEEGAGFMADGYARMHNQLGVCLSIGAPGAANMVPALLAASSDRTKLLCLTGGSAMDIAGKSGFQDNAIDGTNDALLMKPATRYSEACHVTEHVPRKWQAALQAVFGNLPGAAHLTLPRDLQMEKITSEKLDYSGICQPRFLVDVHALDYLAKKYLHKEKIAFLVGRGAVLSHASDALKTFVEHYHIPFALTFSAKGLLPETHPLCLGMFGYAGHKRAIETLLSSDIDTLIILGCSLNARDTLCWSKELQRNKTLVQIDLDNTMLHRNYPVTYAVQSDCVAALDYFNQKSLPKLTKTIPARKAWLKELSQISLFYNKTHLQQEAGELLEPGYLIARVNQLMPENTICYIDSGAHRAFAGHYWITKPGGKIISATNIGPMGWAISAAIGGKLAAPEHPVLVITGDGCMRMHGMEIATAARYQVPVIFLISNNDALGNVYLREKKENSGAMEMTILSDIDWVLFGKAFGVDGVTVREASEIPQAVEMALSLNKPFIINAITNRDAMTPVEPYEEMVKEWLDS
jgi:acetolactate synthase-1/2/3 large subunit